MSVLLVIYATFCVVTGESLNNNEHLSNIGYMPGEAQNTVIGPDTGGSNIVEVRVLPDPDFIPPQNIKIDRKGSSLKDENVRTISRTVSRISTRIEVSRDKKENTDNNSNAKEFEHFKPVDIQSMDANLHHYEHTLLDNELESSPSNIHLDKVSPGLRFSEFKQAYKNAKKSMNNSVAKTKSNDKIVIEIGTNFALKQNGPEKGNSESVQKPGLNRIIAKPVVRGTSNYVIKSIKNAMPDVVVMEEATREDKINAKEATKKSVDKKTTSIVSVKRVANGLGSNNSTLYRIKKKRRKTQLNSRKKPKSISNFSVPKNISILKENVLKTGSNDTSKKHKVLRSGVKKIRKKRLKGDPKHALKAQKKTQQNTANPSPTSENTLTTKTNNITSQPLHVSRNKVKKDRHRLNKLKIRRNRTTTSKPFANWNGDIDINDTFDELVPTPLPLVSLASYTVGKKRLPNKEQRTSPQPSDNVAKLQPSHDISYRTKLRTTRKRQSNKKENDKMKLKKIEVKDKKRNPNISTDNHSRYPHQNMMKHMKKITQRKPNTNSKALGTSHSEFRPTLQSYTNEIGRGRSVDDSKKGGNMTKSKSTSKRRKKIKILKSKPSELNKKESGTHNSTNPLGLMRNVRKISNSIDKALKKDSQVGPLKMRGNMKSDAQPNTSAKRRTHIIKHPATSPAPFMIRIKETTTIKQKEKDKHGDTTNLKEVDWIQSVEMEHALAMADTTDEDMSSNHTNDEGRLVSEVKTNVDNDKINFKDVFDYYLSVENNNDDVETEAPIFYKEIIPVTDPVITTTLKGIPILDESFDLTYPLPFESKRIKPKSDSFEDKLLLKNYNPLKKQLPDLSIKSKKDTMPRSHLIGSYQGIQNVPRKDIIDTVPKIIPAPKKTNIVLSEDSMIIKTPPSHFEKQNSNKARNILKNVHSTKRNEASDVSGKTMTSKLTRMSMSSYPSSKDIPGHSAIFEEGPKEKIFSLLKNKKEKIKIDPVKIDVHPHALRSPTNSSSTFSSNPTTSTPNFSSPPVDGKWYPIIPKPIAPIIQKKYPKSLDIVADIYEKANNIHGMDKGHQGSKPRTMNTISTVSAKDNERATFDGEKEGTVEEVNRNNNYPAKDSSSFKAINENTHFMKFSLAKKQPDFPYLISNRDVHIKGTDKEKRIIEKEVFEVTAVPSSENYSSFIDTKYKPNDINIGLNIYEETISNPMHVEIDANQNTDILKSNPMSDNALSLNPSYPRVNLTNQDIPLLGNDGWFENFGVALTNTTNLIEGNQDVERYTQDGLRRSSYQTPLLDTKSYKPYERVERDHLVPNLTPLSNEGQSYDMVAPSSSDENVKREIGKSIPSLPSTLYREQVANSRYQPNEYEAISTSYQHISVPSHKQGHDAIAEYKQAQHNYRFPGRSLDTGLVPNSFRDDSVDFGAATGHSGAFGWYSDHPVGFGENKGYVLG